jgi:hypothetical protein
VIRCDQIAPQRQALLNGFAHTPIVSTAARPPGNHATRSILTGSASITADEGVWNGRIRSDLCRTLDQADRASGGGRGCADAHLYPN